MRKTPPVPEPPGHAYCFVCAKLQPEAEYPLRGGKLSRPCRSCRRTASERNAQIRAALEAAYQSSLNPGPSRPYQGRVSGACYTMAGFAEWHDQQQRRALRAARKAAKGAPKDHPQT